MKKVKDQLALIKKLEKEITDIKQETQLIKDIVRFLQKEKEKSLGKKEKMQLQELEKKLKEV